MGHVHAFHILLLSLLFLLLTIATSAAGTIPVWDDKMSEDCSLTLDITLQCCIQHDQAYCLRGSRPDRHSADVAFRQCLQDEGWPVLSWVSYGAVRIGRHPIVPSWFLWGFWLLYAWGQYDQQPATPAAPNEPSPPPLTRGRAQQPTAARPLADPRAGNLSAGAANGALLVEQEVLTETALVKALYQQAQSTRRTARRWDELVSSQRLTQENLAAATLEAKKLASR